MTTVLSGPGSTVGDGAGRAVVPDWIVRAAGEIARHVKTARSPAFQSTAEYKIQEAHDANCSTAELRAEVERLLTENRVAWSTLEMLIGKEAAAKTMNQSMATALAETEVGDQNPRDSTLPP